MFIISLFSIKIPTGSISPEETLQAAFASSGARAVSTEIYFNGKSPSGRSYGRGEIKELGLSLAEAFGARNAGTHIKSVENEASVGVELDCPIDSYRNLHISTMSDKSGGDAGKCYISASMVDTSGVPSLAGVEDRVSALFNKNDITVKVNSCISGYFEGRLDDKGLNAICAAIFMSAHATKVEGIRDRTLISVSAYSPDLGRSIEVNGNKINMNLAIRYNSYEDKTYIWLATPVITTEY